MQEVQEHVIGAVEERAEGPKSASLDDAYTRGRTRRVLRRGEQDGERTAPDASALLEQAEHELDAFAGEEHIALRRVQQHELQRVDHIAKKLVLVRVSRGRVQVPRQGPQEGIHAVVAG